MKNLKEEKIKLYVAELLNWNKNYNLIGRSTENEVWKIHIENSLEILPYLEKEKCVNIIDVGSGAGLPAIPLAIFLPEKTFYLTEVNSKKLAFLTFITKKLNLNVRIVNINEGFFLEDECIVISRAFSSIKEIIKWEKRHLLNVLKTYVFKGQPEKINDELKDVKIEKYEIIKLNKGNLVIF